MARDKPDYFYKQSAVIPVVRKGGDLEVLLITSRKKKRWIVPKGIVEKKYTPADSAAKEALEEAGILGKTISHPIGKYRYKKWGGVCTVEVFVMFVERELDRWLESQRERRWFGLGRAVKLVEESGLRKLLERLEGFLSKHHV
ncbi:MAG: NUDIX hydrolase [Magnetococcales bacterium]|nr:NUDIX hydrolase [Magnetococcales bacterium]MBF0149023.1 NUDIX hydrolase [Magnetococcales bacterium]MBF0172072.1 NUDIX hydrolase [Magnetococcales bacterium]MBF0346184.1 NUDIX hydrolase [Magnetococcales bacterium]MBF0630323.1 NUDIX hydrolase [Magnetococcales bacterium]